MHADKRASASQADSLLTGKFSPLRSDTKHRMASHSLPNHNYQIPEAVKEKVNVPLDMGTLLLGKRSLDVGNVKPILRRNPT
jgi:hypothetical protein